MSHTRDCSVAQQFAVANCLVGLKAGQTVRGYKQGSNALVEIYCNKISKQTISKRLCDVFVVALPSSTSSRWERLPT